MKRREFLSGAGVASAGVALAAPAIAQGQQQGLPKVTWRLTSSFPTTLDIAYGGAETLARIVSEMTDGQFTIEIYPAGELTSPLENFAKVQEGWVDCAQTALHYHWGNEPALAFGTAVPFGMNARQQNAFFRQGGGTDLFNEILLDHKLYALPMGNTGSQMGGWFKNELRSVADFKGLKFRISGLAAKVLQKIGCVPQAVARADIASGFTNGTLDAAAWVSPYDDEKLELTKVAPWYYYPGWWQGSSAVHLLINLDGWNKLPRAYQSVLKIAAEFVNADVQARYDALNPAALKRLVESGARLRPFPPDVMDACWQAAFEVYNELAASDPKFKRVYEIYMSFRNDQYLWWQVAEYPYDNFIIRSRAKG